MHATDRPRLPAHRAPALATFVALLALVLPACSYRSSHTATTTAIGTASTSARTQLDDAAIVDGPTATGNAIAVTDDRHASRIAMQVLANGGNAVDATIAAAFVLAVTRPDAGNLGGGGFMLIDRQGAPPVMIDCREQAPAAATEDMFLDAEGNADNQRSLWSGAACGVPGTVAGLEDAHRRFGSRPWRELVEPAITLAAEGFVVDAALADLFATYRDRLARWPDSRRLFLRGGDAPWRQGERLVQPELAATLRAIRDGGAGAFYHGATAERLVATVEATGGRVTLDDLAGYRVRDRQPVTTTYRGYEVLSASPPSSGGLVLALLLAMTERLDLGAGGAATLDDAVTTHRMVEMMKRAYAARSVALGDPDFVDVDTDAFLSDAAVAHQLSSLGDRATPAAALGGAGASGEGESTTHLSVVDAADNAVAFTTTLNATFGSGILVAGGGFLLNNEMDDFTAKPGAPNLYGLVQGRRNRIEPGKRPLSSMTPTILRRGGVPVMTLGSPGGSHIINAVYQVLVHQTEFGLSPVAAVEHPRVHHQYLPDAVTLEPGAGSRRAGLEERGHVVAAEPAWIGHVHLGARLDGGWIGVADRRRGGTAAALVR